MGNRYILTYRNYDDKFWREYQTAWLFKAIIRTVMARMKYDIVTLNYRR